MKKIIALLILLSMVLLMSSCIFKSHPPCVTQPFENVVSIELLDTDNYEENVLYTLSNDEFENFWAQFMDLEFARMVNDPPTEYGKLAVRITYIDGSTDTIGIYINRSKDSQGERISTGWYSLLHDNNDRLLSLFSQYVDESLLPQLD